MHQLTVTVGDLHPQAEEASKGRRRADQVREISLAIRFSDGSTRQIWHFYGLLSELTRWVELNAAALLKEEPPGGITMQRSIALCLDEFYEHADPERDQLLLEDVYSYRMRHGLRFAYRGTDLPDLYIGLFGGRYEVSCAEGQAWAFYPIDLPRFVAEMSRGTMAM